MAAVAQINFVSNNFSSEIRGLSVKTRGRKFTAAQMQSYELQPLTFRVTNGCNPTETIIMPF